MGEGLKTDHDRNGDHGPGGGGVVTFVREKGGVSNLGSAKRGCV